MAQAQFCPIVDFHFAAQTGVPANTNQKIIMQDGCFLDNIIPSRDSSCDKFLLKQRCDDQPSFFLTDQAVSFWLCQMKPRHFNILRTCLAPLEIRCFSNSHLIKSCFISYLVIKNHLAFLGLFTPENEQERCTVYIVSVSI